NIIVNNVLLYFNTKFLRLSFGWYVRHQIVSVLAFLCVAWGVTFGIDHWFVGVGILVRFLGAGLGYLVAIVGGVYFFPGLLGLARQDVVVVDRILMRHRHKIE
ncbi:MAG: hypothetical protein NT079_02500, partial [Candidatus Omnitrophica bacterium]|nr:hypothetical protein [Candidatus Omnitrophota bacterium]